jgi:hypothetical protein
MASTALWFPPLVATLIAVSILLVALENIVGARVQRRSRMAYGFGLIYGFGMAFVLSKMLQFGGSHLLVSVLSFNTGIIVGEIFTLLLIALAIELLFQFVVEERMGTIVLSAIAAHTAWHWMVDRYTELRKFPLQWPTIDALFLVGSMRWAMIAVTIAAVVWLFGVLRPLVRRGSGAKDRPKTSPSH